MFRIGWDIVVAVANIELTVGNSDDARICGCVTMRTRVAVLRPWEGVGDASNARDTGFPALSAHFSHALEFKLEKYC